MQNTSPGAGEAAQWLRAHILLAEDAGLLPNTQMVAHNHPEDQGLFLAFVSARHAHGTHECIQAKHSHVK